MSLQNIKNGIEGHAIDWYGDVFKLVFPDVDTTEINNLWKNQLRESDSDKKTPKVIEDIGSQGMGDNV